MDAVVFCGLILTFFVYSFLGWCCECVYCSIPAGHFINRGFLNGPLCPVYGFGALAVVYCLTPVSFNICLLFVCGVIVTSTLEYITGWLLEKLFHTKWWDYSGYRFNLHGRVCLLNSTLFGLLSVFAMYVVHPFVAQTVGSLSMIAMIWWSSACTTLLVVDLWLSARAALQLSGKLDALQAALAEAKERTEAAVTEGHLQFALFKEMPLNERIDALLEKGEGARLRERLARLSHSHNFMHRRILDAFPHMQSVRNAASLAELKNAIARMRAEQKKNWKER